jgi:Asp/Glu/hydantoin racemase
MNLDATLHLSDSQTALTRYAKLFSNSCIGVLTDALSKCFAGSSKFSLTSLEHVVIVVGRVVEIGMAREQFQQSVLFVLCLL